MTSRNRPVRQCARLLRAGLLSTASVVTPAWAAATAPGAQGAAPPPARSGAKAGGASPFEDIVVTAQKRRQSTQKIGLSITAFSHTQLDSLGVKDVRDIVALVPGFTVAKSFRGPPIYTLRGVGFNTPNLSTSSPVGIYLDEVAYPYPIETEGLSFDLERVEVLKGPQGTLYGRNTTGGLINNISRKPTDSTDGELEASYGSYGTKEIKGYYNTPITSTLLSRLAFDVIRSDQGWQRNIVTGQHLGKVDKAAARFSVSWEPTSYTKFLLTGNWWKDNSDTQAAQSIYIFAKGLAANGVPPSEWAAVGPALGVPESLFTQAFQPTSADQANWDVNQTQWGGTVGGHNFIPAPAGQLTKDNSLASIALRGDIALTSGIKLTSLTAYTDFRRNETVDPAGIALENGLTNERGRIETISQELRLAGESKTLSWIAGLTYAHDNIREIDNNWGATTTDIDPLRVISSNILAAEGASLVDVQNALWGFRDWRNQNSQSISTKAVFGQTEWRFAPGLSLTTGLRYTVDDATFSGCSQDRGDDSIAATWNAFFANYLGIPSNVAPGGCVTYLDNLTKYVVPNPAFVPITGHPAFLLAPGVGPFPGQGPVNKSLSEDNLSGRVGLNWQAAPNVLAYGYFARGYKSGAFPNVSANVATQYDPARQERLLAYEVGVKTRPFLNTTVNAAAFYYDYKDKQVFGYVPDIVYGSLNRIVNIPKSHLYGAELEVTVPVLPGLTAHGSATYINTKIDEYSGYDDFGVPRDFKGASYTFTPKFQANAVLSYNVDVSDHTYMTFTFDGRYSGEQHADLIGDPRFVIDPYFVADLNALLALADDKYELSLFVKNIGDTYYSTSVQLNEDSLVRYAGMPRTWGISLKARF